MSVAAGAVPGARPWRFALGWLLLLAPFFFATYGFANWVASMRPSVPSIVFGWERHIPFLPWTIVPYWSIDLLYGLALFLCATRAELSVLVRRLMTAQIVAVACFLLFPLRFSFTRPETADAFGWMFGALESFDQPFNQAPSLHIALLVILWGVYLRSVPRTWRVAVHALFVLIGISVLTTWQHHFIDIPTGAWLGWLCVWLHPDDARSPFASKQWVRVTKRRMLAGCYALAALALAMAALMGGGVGLWLLWASGALALVALIYAVGDAVSFQKQPDGSFAPAVWGLMGAYIVGAWINSRCWTRGLMRANAVVPGVLLGRVPTSAEVMRDRYDAIVDLSAELPCSAACTRYVNVPMLDLLLPSTERIEYAVIAIEAARAHGSVLVCCALGFSRSAAAVAAWLVKTDRAATIETAVAMVQRARPAIVLHADYLAALNDWQLRYVTSARRQIDVAPSACVPDHAYGS